MALLIQQIKPYLYGKMSKIFTTCKIGIRLQILAILILKFFTNVAGIMCGRLFVMQSNFYELNTNIDFEPKITLNSEQFGGNGCWIFMVKSKFEEKRQNEVSLNKIPIFLLIWKIVFQKYFGRTRQSIHVYNQFSMLDICHEQSAKSI